MLRLVARRHPLLMLGGGLSLAWWFARGMLALAAWLVGLVGRGGAG